MTSKLAVASQCTESPGLILAERSSFITKLVHRILKGRENVAYKNTAIGLFVPFPISASQPVYKLTTVALRVICLVVKVW